MTNLETAKKNLADALREFKDADMMNFCNDRQFANKIERMENCAGRIENCCRVVSLELRANESGVVSK